MEEALLVAKLTAGNGIIKALTTSKLNMVVISVIFR